jgi:hypothetical protein
LARGEISWILAGSGAGRPGRQAGAAFGAKVRFGIFYQEQNRSKIKDKKFNLKFGAKTAIVAV